ncbi:hypothetical protein COW49_03295 [Candidatus Kaiserbacteria bacterium CG17_big_fil_post_rev_8_21_14_2_50_51_7]|uniref:L-lactate permease n=1 Tax=Candidatus Kaiserbacteria bacterium CG17_big_fil_post_rev_8_21_14_2_50_51_7 TaxID=1974613 RepID=A0A2M7FD26_9BACT|nr:MAG: hypothetical protein COW49_03295 [Candidatus Kaiserbacteria bacterium CG17_big_fil_post_rev_8_21_14_2_50_51_7]PJA01103.1 MAG: hypothetical protein COX76_00235 [Candidatus Kaiserbacteria bacterium CG_4_10_14_0_2_um_filter_50_16]
MFRAPSSFRTSAARLLDRQYRPISPLFSSHSCMALVASPLNCFSYEYDTTKYGLKYKNAFVTLVVFTLLATFYWHIVPDVLFISYANGFFVAFDIFIIIFGAIFFLKIIQELEVIKNVSYYLEHFSRDYRIQIIILAWFFENFIEWTAGFGTPVAVVAPLLVGLGLPVISALVIALLGNSASVVFGAAGTPIRTGFARFDVSLALGSIGISFSFITPHVFNLFNPGFAFIFAGLVTMFIWKSGKRIFSSSIANAFLRRFQTSCSEIFSILWDKRLVSTLACYCRWASSGRRQAT